jgi:hypothetical protein
MPETSSVIPLTGQCTSPTLREEYGLRALEDMVLRGIFEREGGENFITRSFLIYVYILRQL